MSERKRQRRLMYAYNRTMKEFWIFIYNADRKKIAELNVTEDGRVVVTQGIIVDCPANRAKIKADEDQ